MGFNIHILSVRNRSTNLPSHAALAASFNPPNESASRAFGMSPPAGLAGYLLKLAIIYVRQMLQRSDPARDIPCLSALPTRERSRRRTIVSSAGYRNG
jgi:hypothetical protein